MVAISGQGKKHSVPPLAQQESSATREEEEQATAAEASAPQQVSQGTGIPPCEMAFRPLTRIERRTLWLKEYGEQDVALQLWTRLVEQQDWEIEMMLQMHGLLVFGVMVSTLRYAQFYVDLNEELHREHEPETADALRDYYLALYPYARCDDHERGTQDQASFLARQTERGGCVRGGRDGFGGNLLVTEGGREGLVVERLLICCFAFLTSSSVIIAVGIPRSMRPSRQATPGGSG